ncbi:MAG TPA: hypothetical protein VJW20_01165 [Candidatus Angelobacter sp.]|nr:hypothetical protein [Candidatus Angelobacter sp.]
MIAKHLAAHTNRLLFNADAAAIRTGSGKAVFGKCWLPLQAKDSRIGKTNDVDFLQSIAVSLLDGQGSERLLCTFAGRWKLGNLPLDYPTSSPTNQKR